MPSKFFVHIKLTLCFASTAIIFGRRMRRQLLHITVHVVDRTNVPTDHKDGGQSFNLGPRFIVLLCRCEGADGTSRAGGTRPYSRTFSREFSVFTEAGSGEHAPETAPYVLAK